MTFNDCNIYQNTATGGRIDPEIGAKILEESDIKVESINDLGSAAKKSVELAK